MNEVAIVTNPPYRLRAEVLLIEKAFDDGTRLPLSASAELPGIHAPEGVFRDAPALKGLGVLAPAADDAPARMNRVARRLQIIATRGSSGTTPRGRGA